MPIIVYHKIKNEDIMNNPNCYFIYSENEKQEGGNVFMREEKNCLPLTVKKSASKDVSGYWDDSTYSYNVQKFTEDTKLIFKVLDKKGIVIVENTFLSDENNSPMKTYGARTLLFLNASMKTLKNDNEPKNIPLNLIYK
mgnify:FL=1|tara:strand:+ start:708 stop:1124 length:417 start_codon:yes stop_codon:yes gene_type:complete